VKKIHRMILTDGGGQPEYVEYAVLTKSGEERLIAWHNTVLTDDAGDNSGVLSSGEDITERKIAEIKIKESEEKYRSLFENVPDGVYRIDSTGNFIATNPGLVRMLGYQSEQELQAVNISDLFYDEQERKSTIAYLSEGSDVQNAEIRLRQKQGRLIVVLNNAIAVRNSNREVLYYEGTLTDITKLKQAEAELASLYQIEQQRVKRLSTLQKITGLLAGIHSEREVMEIVASQTGELVDTLFCAVLKMDEENEEWTLVAQSGLPAHSVGEQHIYPALPVLQQVAQSEKPLFFLDIDRDAAELRLLGLPPEVQSVHAYPISQEGRRLGIMVLGSRTAAPPSGGEITALHILVERAAAALDNARLFDEINQNLQRLASLRSIDQAITSSLDVGFTLGIILDQVVGRLKVDAADILLLDQGSTSFRYGSGRGFKMPVPQHILIGIENNIAGRAVYERRTIQVSNLAEEPSEYQKMPHFAKEGFTALFCTPLIAKGQVKGVLEVFHREPLKPAPDWVSFLETLAGQAAIAIDNAELFAHLQRSNADLSMAYEATIQGWSDALDLRDKETEGHTQRVTEMTLRLASLMGFDERARIHIRRGALLHDIGKMGIPDSILLKPGPLTDDEWVFMRRHPEFAYDLISPIAYLRPALDIPYCHHERWDGSGYPRGLAGEQIPLAARIFAIVDVWDALTSDRPYRAAWSRHKTLEYIREHKGSHFDPRLVDVFMDMVVADGEG
ncbi:MAG: PAS domain S-box protein, partial [Chloroflexi bacterium]|nr:PAS domain S-box protein [Chloroflexota bacterium]